MRTFLPAALLVAAAAAACSDAAAPAARARPLPLAASVIGGDDYACALLASGTIHCTGAVSTVPGALTGMLSMSAGEQHACGIHQSGAVRCWGVNTHGRLLAPAGTDFRAVAPGTYHACALRASGEIVCWGDDGDGQATPPRGPGFRAVASSRGSHFSCALRDDGSIECWGVGYGEPPAGAGWIDLVLTQAGGCVVDAARDLTCWGPGMPGPIDGAGVTSVSAGLDLVCLVRSGRVACDGEADPAILHSPAGDDFVQVGAGYRHACALRAHGTVTCWGSMTAFPGIAQD